MSPTAKRHEDDHRRRCLAGGPERRPGAARAGVRRRPGGRRRGAPTAVRPAAVVHSSALHADHGDALLCGAPVQGFTGEGRVTGVRLADGRLLPADVVVVGVGVLPATGWLAGSGVRVDDGVVCDVGGATSVPNVVAVGDVARCPNPFTGRHTRIEHWTNAVEQPATAARTLLSGTAAPAPAAAPYFWSDQYGTRIQLAGQVGPEDVPVVVEGDLDERSFAAVYRREGCHEVAVLAVNRPKSFGRLRRTLRPAPHTPWR